METKTDFVAGLLEQFFTQRTTEDAVAILAPHLDGPHRAELRTACIAIARGQAKQVRDRARAVHDAHMARDDLKSAVIGAVLAAATQRYAAIRLLASFTDEPDVFEFLWKRAQSERDDPNDALGGLNEEAIMVLAGTLPERASFFLAQYRAPYAMRPIAPPRSMELHAVTTPKIAAGTILIIGCARCPAGLQAEIVRTVTFAYYLAPDARKPGRKYTGFEHPDYNARRGMCELLYRMFFSGEHRRRFDDAAFRQMFHDHFLDAFLEVFRDDGSVYGEEVAIAMQWGDETRVVDAFAEFLERWGGTFLNEDETRNVLGWLAHCSTARVTHQLVRAVDNVERQLTRVAAEEQAWSERYAAVEDDPVARDAWRRERHAWSRGEPYEIGDFSTGEILEAIAVWRKAKREAIAALGSAPPK